MSKKSIRVVPSLSDTLVFSLDEQKIIGDCAGLCVDWGFPLTSFDLGLIVMSYMDQRGIREKGFLYNFSDKDWTSLLKRLEDSLNSLTVEVSESEKQSIDDEEAESYFKEVEASLEGEQLDTVVDNDTSNSDDPGLLKLEPADIQSQQLLNSRAQSRMIIGGSQRLLRTNQPVSTRSFDRQPSCSATSQHSSPSQTRTLAVNSRAQSQMIIGESQRLLHTNQPVSTRSFDRQPSCSATSQHSSPSQTRTLAVNSRAQSQMIIGESQRLLLTNEPESTRSFNHQPSRSATSQHSSPSQTRTPPTSLASFHGEMELEQVKSSRDGNLQL